MPKYDLSILIPARNEMFLARTIQDILEHKEGKTEVIAVLDGQWAEPGIPDHPDVTVVYLSESIGQRAATNLACRLSDAKYVAKSDAHVSFSQGFDVELMKTMEGHDDWTIVPTMRNLHAFNWVCEKGHTRYQGPSGNCKECGKPTTRDVVWIAKESPQSNSFRFDHTLHFQYFNDYAKRDEFKRGVNGDTEMNYTMSLQGSFFMLTRDKYWELNICDEAHGSWGQQGVEVACKTWLSGGEVVVDRRAYYAHMFRTQGGDFGFPYPLSGQDVEKARKHSRDLWLNGGFKGKYDLQWLIDKFSPVPDWEASKQPGSRAIVFFTDNQLPLKIAKPVQAKLREISQELGIPIVSSSLKPMDKMGKNIHIKAKRGYLTMFKQILAALEATDAEIIFMAEHDVMYPKEHFQFTPQDRDTFYYDQNWLKYHLDDGTILHWDADQVSGLCAYREKLIEYYQWRIATYDEKTFDRKFEPGSGIKSMSWWADVPHIDIRHDRNLTYNKRGLEHFRDKSTAKNFKEVKPEEVPYWNLSSIL